MKEVCSDETISSQIRQWFSSMRWVVGSLLVNSTIIALVFSSIAFILKEPSYL